MNSKEIDFKDVDIEQIFTTTLERGTRIYVKIENNLAVLIDKKKAIYIGNARPVRVGDVLSTSPSPRGMEVRFGSLPIDYNYRLTRTGTVYSKSKLEQSNPSGIDNDKIVFLGEDKLPPRVMFSSISIGAIFRLNECEPPFVKTSDTTYTFPKLNLINKVIGIESIVIVDNEDIDTSTELFFKNTG